MSGSRSWWACAAFLWLLLPLGAQAPAGDKNQPDLKQLVLQLGSPDHNERQAAYATLQRLRDPRCVALIGKQIEQFSQVSQLLASNVLAGLALEHTRALYKQLLAAKPPYLRVVAAARLLASNEPLANQQQLIDGLAQSLKLCPPAVRQLAMQACHGVVAAPVCDELRAWLATTSPIQVVPLLRELLRREQGASTVTSAAALLLLQSSEPRVVAAAHAYLVRESPEHVAKLHELLLQDKELFWPVYELLPANGKADAAVAELVAVALREPRSQRDVAPLARLLAHHDPRMLAAVLRELVGHDNDDVRAAALQQLVMVPGGLTTKDLQELLVSKAVIARLTAADVLRRRDDPVGLEAVLQALPQAGKHKAEAVRVLGRFRVVAAVPALLDLLDDPDQIVRLRAFVGLQETLRSLFPYRRFDFGTCSYNPQADVRAAGIAQLRAWWGAAK